MIDVDLLRVLGASQSSAALYAPILDRVCPYWEIDEPREVASFLGNTAHESTNYQGIRFGTVRENLNYSAQGLANTWARFSATGIKRGPPNKLAMQIERKPELIANIVYANRMGNGDANSGDGWRYAGKGLIQCTGLDNYILLRDEWGVDVVSSPEILLEPEPAVISACWFWKSHGCNELAQAGEWEAVRRKINGGDNGLADVLRLTDIALEALGAN